ncbi:MAG: hypothetical protein LBB21_03020 [Holosporaceae bacterium]|jgi:hypothetical protein|nr:hypothetical protein [Holosporaceae bacterium]
MKSKNDENLRLQANCVQKRGTWKVLLSIIAINVVTNMFSPTLHVDAMGVRRVYNQNEYNLGFLDVKDFGELSLWLNSSFNGEENRGRVKEIFSRPEVFKKLMSVCGISQLGRCEGLSVPTVVIGETITFHQLVLNNCDNKNDLYHTLLSLRLCYGTCAGDLVKILTLFLCSGEVKFSENLTVSQVKGGLRTDENAFIGLIHNFFVRHISKHWLTKQIKLDQDILERSAVVSGFVLCNANSLGLSGTHTANDVAQSILNFIITKFSARLSEKLSIIVEHNKRLIISSVSGLLMGGDATMFCIDVKEFSTGTKRGNGGKIIDGFYMMDRHKDENGTLLPIPAGCSYDIPFGKYIRDIIITNPALVRNNVKVVDVRRTDDRKVLSFFFKLNISNSVTHNSVGSFYVRDK